MNLQGVYQPGKVREFCLTGKSQEVWICNFAHISKFADSCVFAGAGVGRLLRFHLLHEDVHRLHVPPGGGQWTVLVRVLHTDRSLPGLIPPVLPHQLRTHLHIVQPLSITPHISSFVQVLVTLVLKTFLRYKLRQISIDIRCEQR